ncbi:MAG: sulfatase [Phycisphaeraceae bacterium]|nr:sulfatase [Phycisphaeraceae bacterium]
MKKTCWMIALLVWTGCAALPSGVSGQARPIPTRKYNILLIAIDDLNDWVGCLGANPDAKTPGIDRLAARGVLFTNAHCQAPICNPSRTSFMLGLRPSTTGIYMNRPWFRSTPANKDRVTLTQHFGDQGYKTLATGKIYHTSRKDPPSFQVQGPRPGQRVPQDKKLVRDIASKSRLWDYGPQLYEEEKFGDHITADWAVRQLKERHDKPFFLSVGFYRPHVPWYAPKRIFDQIDHTKLSLPPTKKGDRDDLPAFARKLTENPLPPPHEWWMKNDRWKKGVEAYHASTRFTDEQVARLLDALDQSPYAENTIVVLLSDHGFFLGEKQRWAKQSLWERATRVPLIVSVPGGSTGRCERPAELLSLFPTLIDLCGVAKREELEGASLRPLLENPKAPWKRPAICTFGQNNHAIRSERYRYIQYADGSRELYDHQTDPNEWTNLAADPAYGKIMAEHARWIPKLNVPDARGTRSGKANKAKAGRSRSK